MSTDSRTSTDVTDGPTADAPAPRSTLLWGVGAVSLRLGIATPTLRTWDRRYGLGPSSRTDGGHRRYTEVDVQRLELMSHLLDDGVAAAQAAAVAIATPDVELARALRTPGGAPETDGEQRLSAVAVHEILRAAERLDGAALSRIFSRTLERRGVVASWVDVLAPALREIGVRWSTGAFGIESEHLASDRLATEMRAVIRSRRATRVSGPPIVLAAAEDEQHDLPLLALEAALLERGREAYSLGARMPAIALTGVIEKLDPAVVFVWASLRRPEADAFMTAVPPREGGGSRTLLLGGPGWSDTDLSGAPDGVDAVLVDDLLAAVERASES